MDHLYVQVGYGGGVTPLIDVDGKPVITKQAHCDTQETLDWHWLKGALLMNTVTLRRFRSGDESAVSDVICTTLAISNRKDYLPACFGIVSYSHFYAVGLSLAGHLQF